MTLCGFKIRRRASAEDKSRIYLTLAVITIVAQVIFEPIVVFNNQFPAWIADSWVTEMLGIGAAIIFFVGFGLLICLEEWAAKQ